MTSENSSYNRQNIDLNSRLEWALKEKADTISELFRVIEKLSAESLDLRQGQIWQTEREEISTPAQSTNPGSDSHDEADAVEDVAVFEDRAMQQIEKIGIVDPRYKSSYFQHI